MGHTLVEWYMYCSTGHGSIMVLFVLYHDGFTMYCSMELWYRYQDMVHMLICHNGVMVLLHILWYPYILRSIKCTCNIIFPWHFHFTCYNCLKWATKWMVYWFDKWICVYINNNLNWFELLLAIKSIFRANWPIFLQFLENCIHAQKSLHWKSHLFLSGYFNPLCYGFE